MTSFCEEEYFKRIDILYLSFLPRIKPETEKEMKKEFYNQSKNIYNEFDIIRLESSNFYFQKYFETIPFYEKEMYNLDKTIFQKKYVILAQLECYFRYISFVKTYFHIIFELNFKQDKKKVINIKNSLLIHQCTFLNEFKVNMELFHDYEKQRINFICNEIAYLIEKIEKRLNINDLLLYFSIFYKGSAQKINCYDLQFLIYEYMKPKYI